MRLSPRLAVWEGVRRSVVVLSPNCPAWFLPQQLTEPSSRTAQV